VTRFSVDVAIWFARAEPASFVRVYVLTWYRTRCAPVPAGLYSLVM